MVIIILKKIEIFILLQLCFIGISVHANDLVKKNEYQQRNDFDTFSVQNSNDNCSNIREFFLDALSKGNKPGGLVFTKNSCVETLTFPDISNEEVTLVEKLNLITQMSPNFVWKDDDDVFTLAPTNSMSNLLDTQINSLKLEDGYNLNLIIGKILQLPEVVEKLKEMKLRQGLQHGGLTSPPSKKKSYELVFKDQTIRQILNEIVRKRGRGVWVYSETEWNGVNTFSLDFSVQ
jgi:hypothetical protein